MDGCQRACAVCGATEVDGTKLLCCGRCKDAHYCGVACQRAAWPSHKAACAAAATAMAKSALVVAGRLAPTPPPLSLALVARFNSHA